MIAQIDASTVACRYMHGTERLLREIMGVKGSKPRSCRKLRYVTQVSHGY